VRTSSLIDSGLRPGQPGRPTRCAGRAVGRLRAPRRLVRASARGRGRVVDPLPQRAQQHPGRGQRLDRADHPGQRPAQPIQRDDDRGVPRAHVVRQRRQQRRFMTKPRYDQVVQIKEFAPVRATDKTTSGNRHGAFSKATAYEGWQRSIFPLAWFDFSPERTVANIVDDDESVAWWVRLHTGDIPILSSDGGQHYNPDLLVIETVRHALDRRGQDEQGDDLGRGTRDRRGEPVRPSRSPPGRCVQVQVAIGEEFLYCVKAPGYAGGRRPVGRACGLRPVPPSSPPQR
jgi:hypothetical protein